jgi:acetyl-CoA C-acetyltransferase
MLSTFSGVQLGSIAIKGALEKIGLAANEVDEVYMGNVCSANLGQSPARQAAWGAGLPVGVPCTTVNKVCASGTKSIMLAAQAVMLGLADVVIAGGMESMSNIPYYVAKARYGYKYGHGEFLDGLVRDGLEDAYQKKPMGVFADQTAKLYNISREEQDAFATASYKKAQSATEAGLFADEIVGVSVPQKKGDPIVLAKDEEPYNVFFDKIPGLRPAFTPDGTVTAANASTINDGAAALVIMSEAKAKTLGLKILAHIEGFADFEQEPELFTTAPAKAIPLALERAGAALADVSLFEINEAFAVVPMAVGQILGLDMGKVNTRGGAVAMGHPLGCSGARIVTTLVHAMQAAGKGLGVAGICNGGGGSSAIVLKL